MNVTAIDIEPEIIRLARVYSPPKGLPSEIAAVWADVLEGIGPDEFRAAVRAYMRGPGKYFPKPSDISDLANVARPRAARFRGDDDPARCHVCGALVRDLPEHPGVPDCAVGKLGQLHDVPTHERAGIPHWGYPLDREAVAMYNTYTAAQSRSAA